MTNNKFVWARAHTHTHTHTNSLVSSSSLSDGGGGEEEEGSHCRVTRVKLIYTTIYTRIKENEFGKKYTQKARLSVYTIILSHKGDKVTENTQSYRKHLPRVFTTSLFIYSYRFIWVNAYTRQRKKKEQSTFPALLFHADHSKSMSKKKGGKSDQNQRKCDQKSNHRQHKFRRKSIFNNI